MDVYNIYEPPSPNEENYEKKKQEFRYNSFCRVMMTAKEEDTDAQVNNFYLLITRLLWIVRLRQELLKHKLFCSKSYHLCLMHNYVSATICALKNKGFEMSKPISYFSFTDALIQLEKLSDQREEYLDNIVHHYEVYRPDFMVINLTILRMIANIHNMWQKESPTGSNARRTIVNLPETYTTTLSKLKIYRELLLQFCKFLILYSEWRSTKFNEMLSKEMAGLFLLISEKEAIVSHLTRCKPQDQHTMEEMAHEMSYRNSRLNFVFSVLGEVMYLFKNKVISNKEPFFRHILKEIDFSLSNYNFSPIYPEKYLCTFEGILVNWNQLCKERIKIIDTICNLRCDRNEIVFIRESVMFMVNSVMWGIHCVVRRYWKCNVIQKLMEQRSISSQSRELLQDCASSIKQLQTLFFYDKPPMKHEGHFLVFVTLKNKLVVIERALQQERMPHEKLNEESILMNDDSDEDEDNPALFSPRDSGKLQIPKPPFNKKFLKVEEIAKLCLAYRNFISQYIVDERDPLSVVIRATLRDGVRNALNTLKLNPLSTDYAGNQKQKEAMCQAYATEIVSKPSQILKSKDMSEPLYETLLHKKFLGILCSLLPLWECEKSYGNICDKFYGRFNHRDMKSLLESAHHILGHFSAHQTHNSLACKRIGEIYQDLLKARLEIYNQWRSLVKLLDGYQTVK